MSVATSAGNIHVRDTGAPGNHNGHTLLLMCGFLNNGDLWRPVVPGLHANGFRVITIDPPMGSHTEPMRRDADLSPAGMARILGETIVALDVGEVTLVGNDSGCAITQLLITSDHAGSDLVARVVFATGDFFENFPPKVFRPLLLLPKIPGGVAAAVTALRAKAFWQSPTSFGWLTNTALPDDIRESFLAPALADADVRDDIGKVLSGLDPQITLDVAERLHTYDRPVLFAWAAEDKFFPVAHAHRAAALMPDATVVLIPGSRTYVMWDNPDALVAAITTFHERA